MAQLTYADRELLLQTLDSITDEWHGADAELLGQAFEWAKQLAPTYGFEHALTRILHSPIVDVAIDDR